MQIIAREGKIERVTLSALHHTRHGVRPDLAWVEGIREVYSADRTKSQLQHTCPKWAFSILCHRGLVAGVAAASCPAAEGKRSADFVLSAREMLLSDQTLANRKQDLKRRVFGLQGNPDYRSPNHEIEVLLLLIGVGALQIQSAGKARNGEITFA
jgi:hypothetical protein